MTARRIAAVAAVLATQGLIGCGGTLLARTTTEAAPDRAWPAAVEAARARVSEGKFDAADSMLADFATRYPGTPEALETAFWRAIFKMDPTNPHVSIPMAISSLDAYLADTRPRSHAVEAATIRRVAGQLDGLTRVAANAMTQAQTAANTAANAKAQVADANARADAAKNDTPPSAESEIKRLKDELAKANSELERIRKRLSQPPPKP